MNTLTSFNYRLLNHPNHEIFGLDTPVILLVVGRGSAKEQKYAALVTTATTGSLPTAEMG